MSFDLSDTTKKPGTLYRATVPDVGTVFVEAPDEDALHAGLRAVYECDGEDVVMLTRDPHDYRRRNVEVTVTRIRRDRLTHYTIETHDKE